MDDGQLGHDTTRLLNNSSRCCLLEDRKLEVVPALFSTGLGTMYNLIKELYFIELKTLSLAAET